MQSPDLAIRELERCVRDLGLQGVEIGSNVNGENLDSPELFPIFEAAASLGAAVFVHPWDMLGRNRHGKYWLPWLVGMPAETATAICSVLFGGVLERLPRLKIGFAHGRRRLSGDDRANRPRLRSAARSVRRFHDVSPREYCGGSTSTSLVHDPDAALPRGLDGPRSDRPRQRLSLPARRPRPGELIDSCGFPERPRARLLHRHGARVARPSRRTLWFGLGQAVNEPDWSFKLGREFAVALDRGDPLRRFRDEVHIPRSENGEEEIYFVGNSLGLLPKRTPKHVDELDGERLAVRRTSRENSGCLPRFAEPMARLVGASASASEVDDELAHRQSPPDDGELYQPTRERHRILSRIMRSLGLLWSVSPPSTARPAEASWLRPEGHYSADRHRGGRPGLNARGSIAWSSSGVSTTGQAFEIEAIRDSRTRRVRRRLRPGAAGNLVLRSRVERLRRVVHVLAPEPGPGPVGGCSS
jgi:hypothetical protein